MEKSYKNKYTCQIIDLPLIDIKNDIEKMGLKDYMIAITISQKKDKPVKKQKPIKGISA